MQRPGSGHSQSMADMAANEGFLAVVTPFFALVLRGLQRPFFSPRALAAVSARGLQGGGDVGSLTPRRSVTLIRCMSVMRYHQRYVIYTPSAPPPPPPPFHATPPHPTPRHATPPHPTPPHSTQPPTPKPNPAFSHSANKTSLLEKEVVEGTHNARQGHKTAAASQGPPVASCLGPGGALSLALPPLAAPASESLSFLVKAAVLAQAELAKRKKKLEEEENEMEQLEVKHNVKKVDKWEFEMEKASKKQHAEVKALQQRAAALARRRENTGKRRKRKKRRKRRTRRTVPGLPEGYSISGR